MRILMLFTLGFGAACGLCVYVFPQTPDIFVPIVIGMISVPLLLLRRWKWLRGCGVTLLGLGVGIAWFWVFGALYLTPAMQLHGQVREATLTAADFGRETDYGYSVDGRLDLDGKTYKVRIYYDEAAAIEPGDKIYGTFRFRYTSPKEGEKTSHYQGKGIFLIADQKEDFRVESSEEHSLRDMPAVLAWNIQNMIREVFPEDVAPFVKALLLGDSSDLPYGADMDLRISGIRHVVAVSGLHVSLLYALIEYITQKRRLLTALIGLPALLLFAAVAGFTPSVSRACLMVALMMLSQLFRQEYDSPTALSFACLIMLIFNPIVISSVSFQLSVGCVAGITMFQGTIRSWILSRIRSGEKDKTKWKNWLASSVAVTLSAMTLTTPLSAIYFGTVSLVGVVTNLLTLWAVNGVFIGIILVCGVYMLAPTLAAGMGWGLAWLIRYILLAAKVLSRAPLAAVYTDSIYIVFWLILCYVLLTAFALLKKKQTVVLACCAALALCVALAFSWAEPLTDSCRVTVLDVGQGQSILLQSGGKTFLVDCGGERDETAADAILRRLYSQGIRKLDGIFLSHCDADHAGALPYVLERVETDMLFLPATEGDYVLPDTDSTVVWVDRETILEFEGCSVRIFPPVFTVDQNENSLCILFETENCGILITGDRSKKGERMLLKHYDLPDVDLLIAGHHGSAKATSEELLQAVTPETVIISVGRNNIYGHPSPEVLQRLEQYGCDVYRTDIHGTVVFRR